MKRFLLHFASKEFWFYYAIVGALLVILWMGLQFEILYRAIKALIER